MLTDYGQFLGFHGAEKVGLVTITLMEGSLAPRLIISVGSAATLLFKGSGSQPYSC